MKNAIKNKLNHNYYNICENDNINGDDDIYAKDNTFTRE